MDWIIVSTILMDELRRSYVDLDGFFIIVNP